MDWLHDTTMHLASEVGLTTDGLALDAATKRNLLQIAKVAAHGSGDRTNASLLCYVLGLMSARGYDVARAATSLGEAPE